MELEWMWSEFGVDWEWIEVDLEWIWSEFGVDLEWI